MLKRIHGLTWLVVAGAAMAPTLGKAQPGGNGWFFECIDPRNTAPYSSPFLVTGAENDFIGMLMGFGGTVTYGSDQGPCYAPTARTLQNQGRFSIYVPGQGSRQSDFDDGMALTFGAPADPVGDYCYARIIRYTDVNASSADKTELFGQNALRAAFAGASRRYFIGIYDTTGAEVNLEARVIGDAVRMRWRLTNTLTNQVNFLGLRFGAYPGMRTRNAGVTDITGANQANSRRNGRTSQDKPTVVAQDGLTWLGFNTTPTTKPLRIERAFRRGRSNFPSYANFQFGQEAAYGLRVDNQPFPETPDATPVEHFKVGNHTVTLWENNMNLRVFTDPGVGDPVLDANASPIQEESDSFLSEVSFIQTFAPQAVSPGNFRDVIFYLRSPWSTGDYRDPYAVVVDGPRTVAGSTDAGAVNGLAPNPMTIFTHVDNQFATVDREVPLRNVRLTIFLPDGLSLEDGEQQAKTIASIDPNQIGTVSWNVVASGTVTGKLNYTVRVEPGTGPVRTVGGSVLVSSVPKYRLAEGPNLVTLPFRFTDSALDTILGLKAGVDYTAYAWSPDLGEYVPVTSATRGQALWIVPSADQGFIDLTGAQPGLDAATGGGSVDLKRGWNMIGNPYTYPISLSQLLGVVSDDAANALSWTELIDANYVNSSLASWVRNADDPNSGSYVFTEGSSDILEPNKGYWIFVNTFNPIRLIFPASFVEGLPGSLRTAKASGLGWKQTDQQWRLQLSARTESGQDTSNFVGVAKNAKEATRLRLMEPPVSPNGKVTLSIEESVDGKPTRLAQSLTDKLTRKEWKVVVSAKEAGEVTLNWPNVGTTPRNVRLQLVDKASNQTRDLRFSSGYTFRMDEPGTREFTLQMEPGAPVRALIGDVVVTRPSRDPRAPFTINYALSAPSTTTIRILAGSGKEIYTISRGRSDGAGENTATWAMRDNANRAVAPGTYQVEILAETGGGERVRKIVPINVVR